MAKPFRCNIYKKQGGGRIRYGYQQNSEWLVLDALRSSSHTVIPQSAGSARRAIRGRSILRHSGIPCAPPSLEFLRPKPTAY